MENLLREYLEKNFTETTAPQHHQIGPAVTISREYGCPSKLIAQMLADSLNRRPGADPKHKWHYINKEIVEGLANELELKTVEINYLLSSGGKGILEDIMASFSPLYVSDHRIRKTIVKVVNDMARRGNMVIVGRGGVGVLHGMPGVLNIRLQAPIEWRIPEICKLRNVSEHEAEKLAHETDKKRTSLIELISGGRFHPYLFDITFNCATQSKEDIVHCITGMMAVKHMI